MSYSRFRSGFTPALSKSAGVLDRGALSRICAMSERNFGTAFDMERFEVVEQRAPENFYFFKDNGASVLAVAHLDTVGLAHQRTARFVETQDGPVVFSRALDDRLGAYIILDMLPKLGINVDVLLTVGEETGQSTAAFFEPTKVYNWIIEFDRGGTDVVMYQYDDAEMRKMVRSVGAVPADGIFSDISYMEHLGVKAFNWGVGYEDYHGPRAHAFLNDTCMMVDKWLDFYDLYSEDWLEHEEVITTGWSRSGRRPSGSPWGDSEYPWCVEDEEGTASAAPYAPPAVLGSEPDPDALFPEHSEEGLEAAWESARYDPVTGILAGGIDTRGITDVDMRDPFHFHAGS